MPADSGDTLHRARLRSQLLAGPPARDVGAVCERLLAIQAQDDRGFRLAIRARTTGLSSAAVDEELNEGRAVVSWLNRGTLHLVRSADYWWLHRLTTPQLRTANARRLGQEQVAERHVALAIDLIAAAVDRGPATRGQLRELLDTKRIRTQGQALVHLLAAATFAGAIVRGPVVGREQAFVAPERWLGKPPAPLGRDEALARLALRYLQGHGPATAADLARWAGITLGDARTGLAGIADRTEVRGDLHRVEGTGRPRGEAAPRLLGPFEPVLLGWVSRSAIVGTHHELVTTNGIFRPFAMSAGRAVAVWGLTTKALTITPLEAVADDVQEALSADAVAVQRWLGRRAVPVVFAKPKP